MGQVIYLDNSPFASELLGNFIEGCHHEVHRGGHGREALQILRELVPDLIVTEISLPELDGFAVMRVVRNNPQWRHIPIILVTDEAKFENVVRARDMGVQGYFLKSEFSLRDFKRRMQLCLGEAVAADGEMEVPRVSDARAASEEAVAPAVIEGNRAGLRSVSPVITKADLRVLVTKGLELRPLGHAVTKVLSVSGNPECTADDVAKAIGNDQALAIRVLKLANSSAYAHGRPVESVKDAVQRIGVSELRSLVMTLGVIQEYQGAAGEHLDPLLFWEHSIACGLIATALARHLKHDDPEQYFMWGVLHDVGRLILLEHVPGRYGNVWEEAQRLGLPLEVVEPEMILMDHCEILENALEHWKFPRSFIVPVVNHHRSMLTLARLGDTYSRAAAVVALSNRLAHALLLGASGNEVIDMLEPLVDLVQLEPGDLPTAIAKVEDEVGALKVSMLSHAGVSQWPSQRQRVRAELGVTFRPLTTSERPEIDAFRMVCERLASAGGDEPPNVGIVYVPDARSALEVYALHERAEDRDLGGKLPVVAVFGRGKPDTSAGFLAERRHVVLRTPVRLDQLITAIRSLLGATQPAAAVT